MEDLSGMQLGPYRVITPIGEGGMARVYKAYQASVDRCVAIKVLPQQLALYPEFVGRFQREARVIAKLVHPHILPVHDFGHERGYTFLVMPLIEGCTLNQLLTGQPLPRPQIIQIVTQLADALDYAHGCGIVHRDIKPGNVMLDQRGNCLLTDFGLAQVVEEATRYTQAGAAIGTPAYMSPEQGRGEKVDRRSDIYSLGVVVYEMATGRVPFNADTPVAIVMKHMQEPLPSARALNPALPEAIERVIARAMAKVPADRFGTAGEMAVALQAAAGLSTSATGGLAAAGSERPEKGRGPWSLLAGIHPAVLALLGSGMLVVGVVAVASGWMLAPWVVHFISPPEVARAVSQGRPGPPALDPLAGSRVLYVEDFDGPGLVGWQASTGTHAALDAGCLVLSGSQSWQDGLSLDAGLTEGEGALFLFEYEPKAQFRLELNTGVENQPTWRLWGLEQSPAGGFGPYAAGSLLGMGEPTLMGQIGAAPQRWYLMLLQVGGAGEFVTRVWERDAPGNFVEWRQTMPAAWSGLTWSVRLNTYAGRLIVDRYEQLAFGRP